MEEYLQDGTADSSPATESYPPADATVQPQVPDHRIPYDRFKEVIDQRSEWQARAAAAEQQAQQYAFLLRQAVEAGRRQTPQQTLTEQEAMAAGAVRRIVPEIARIQALEQQLQQIQLMNQQAQQAAMSAQEIHRESNIRNGQEVLARHAQQHGYDTSPRALRHLENNITGIIAENPEAHAAFKRGDLRTVEWAFQVYNQEFGGRTRAAQNAAMAGAKANLSNLPPPMRGGIPGQAAFPRVQPGKEQDYLRQMHAAAGELWKDLG